ncbi:MAG: acetate--CoA ligase family protein [Candidatus Hodarchaeales archaeon]|jgi:acyl-CoA synthetase (NDP forming)
MPDPLDYFFHPKTVAVVGVSRQPKKVGNVVFRNFINSEQFEGQAFPVTHSSREILGREAYRTVTDVPVVPDLVIITTPASFVSSVLEETAKNGSPAAIVVAGGFSEIGEKGLERENEIRTIVAEYGIRVIGPNCLGVFDSFSGVDTLFLPPYRLIRPPQGHIAFISQSGGYGSAILSWCANLGIGVSKFISFGNRVDVDELDLLRYLKKDRKTKTITHYLESWRRGREWIEEARKLVDEKPIIVLKGGETAAGARAAISHTGAVIKSDQLRLFRQIFKQTGIVRATDGTELFDLARALSYLPAPQGSGVGVITNAGGIGVLTADLLSREGLKLAELSPQSLELLERKLPAECAKTNPCDLVGDADAERYRIAMDVFISDPNIHILNVIILPQTSFIDLDIVDVLMEETAKGKPIIVTTIGGAFVDTLIRMLEEVRIPAYPAPGRTVGVLSALLERARRYG